MQKLEIRRHEIWAKARQTPLPIPPAKAGGNSKKPQIYPELPLESTTMKSVLKTSKFFNERKQSLKN